MKRNGRYGSGWLKVSKHRSDDEYDSDDGTSKDSFRYEVRLKKRRTNPDASAWLLEAYHRKQQPVIKEATRLVAEAARLVAKTGQR